MNDPTEQVRRKMVAEIAVMAEGMQTREDAERAVEGQVWDTAQLTQDFDVVGFLAPFCMVVRKSDGQKGSLLFTHNPRWYFNFEAAPTKEE